MKSFFKRLLGVNLTGWKQWLVHAAVLLVLLGVGGLLVAVSGVVPIKASSGHWAITQWFLQFSKKRSVDTHTKTIQAPPLEDQTLVIKGAGHYHVGCMPCHGWPGHKAPVIAHAMLPPPPYLSERLSEWEPEELFYIVKHGIKFTGMPAWPTPDRDDEVWAVVAFLMTYPELDETEYLELATGPNRDGQTPARDLVGSQSPSDVVVSQTCTSCHGEAGQGRGDGAMPRLVGQSAEYLKASLQAYHDRQRHSGIMEPIAAALNADEMQRIANYYGELQTSVESDQKTVSANDPESIERGKAIARQGIPESRVPACHDCHGPGEERRNPYYPRLAGLSAEYLVLQLELFQKQQRGGTERAHLMNPVAKNITADQIRDVAAYYHSVAPQNQVD